jgi:hypothetical protein
MKRYLFFLLLNIFLPAVFCQNNNLQMKKTIVPLIDAEIVPDKADKNNNFYDNEETYVLTTNDLFVNGEVENPGKVDFSGLPIHSVIVKEALLNQDSSNSFVGAYRYDGYSLFDILNKRILKKKNAAEFRPVIDVYVEIENARGEKVVVTWGEIYYPNCLHNILIATRIMRIVPSKTKELWPLPTESKLIIGNDLITERNISAPAKITVRSFPRSYPVNREMTPLVSNEIKLFNGEKQTEVITSLPQSLRKETLHTIFYGKGRGIHSTQPFTGVYLKNYLTGKILFNRNNLRTGLVLLAGADGYRAVFSFSEIMNRNDQAEMLIVPCTADTDGGKFRIFPSCDFFSDRAVKALSEIRFEQFTKE